MAHLILIRHGDALHPAEAMIQGILDSDRPLTHLGINQVQRSAQEISKKLITSKPVLIVSSPYVRAVQTAEFIYQQLQTDHFMIISKEQNASFVPDEDASHAVDLLFELVYQNKVEQIILVSHLPIISEIFGEICRRVKQDKKASENFYTAEWRSVLI